MAQYWKPVINTNYYKPASYPVISADDWFTKNGEYTFDSRQLGSAHKDCKKRVQQAMKNGYEKIFVANTFTKESEIKPYTTLANQHNYTIFSIIVENRHGNASIHDVPAETVCLMADRFSIKLK
jgi:hypothetical protein